MRTGCTARSYGRTAGTERPARGLLSHGGRSGLPLTEVRAFPSLKGAGVPSLCRSLVHGGQELTGPGFVGGGDHYANTLYLQLWFLCSGIVRRHGRWHVVTAQQANDQIRLGAAADYRHAHRPWGVSFFGNRHETTVALQPPRRARGSPRPVPWSAVPPPTFMPAVTAS